eukprot:TRINITY_DN4382_c0_g1_i11.p1 TRINITY_DN4382_c0_g1~~TRINITY_DN4382_c0_g1_i11.p1  ORF type:complete len:500 (+),score=90.05 TRINITY_DN4382_c0_g1_i11:80-1579(+)
MSTLLPQDVIDAHQRILVAFQLEQNADNSRDRQQTMHELLQCWHECSHDLALANLYTVMNPTAKPSSLLFSALKEIHERMTQLATDLLLMSRSIYATQLCSELIGYVAIVNRFKTNRPQWSSEMDAKDYETQLLRTQNFALSILQSAMLRPRSVDSVSAMLQQIGVTDDQVRQIFHQFYEDAMKETVRPTKDRISILQQISWPESLGHPPKLPQECHHLPIHPESLIYEICQFMMDGGIGETEEILSRFPQIVSVAHSPTMHLRFLLSATSLFLETGNLLLARVMSIMGGQLKKAFSKNQSHSRSSFFPAQVQFVTEILSRPSIQDRQSSEYFSLWGRIKTYFKESGSGDNLHLNYMTSLLFCTLWEWPDNAFRILCSSRHGEDDLLYLQFMFHPNPKSEVVSSGILDAFSSQVPQNVLSDTDTQRLLAPELQISLLRCVSLAIQGNVVNEQIRILVRSILQSRETIVPFLHVLQSFRDSLSEAHSQQVIQSLMAIDQG